MPIYGDKDLGTEDHRKQAQKDCLPRDWTIDPTPGLEPCGVHVVSILFQIVNARPNVSLGDALEGPLRFKLPGMASHWILESKALGDECQWS